MWAQGSRFLDRRSVVNQRNRVMRNRARFQPWALTALVLVDETGLEPDRVAEIAELAGRLIGIGDYRPEKRGIYGRYTAKVSDREW